MVDQSRRDHTGAAGSGLHGDGNILERIAADPSGGDCPCFPGAFLGGIPIAIARSAWIGASPSGWRLWAKILMLCGGILCISIPTTVYWTAFVAVPVGVSLGTDQVAPTAISPFDPRLMTTTLLFGGPSFILGLCLIVPALIGGRRRP